MLSAGINRLLKGRLAEADKNLLSDSLNSGHFQYALIISTALLYGLYASVILANDVVSHLLAVRERERERPAVHTQGILLPYLHH